MVTNWQMGSWWPLSYLDSGISSGKGGQLDRVLTWGIIKVLFYPMGNGTTLNVSRCGRPFRTSSSCFSYFEYLISDNWINYTHLAKRNRRQMTVILSAVCRVCVPQGSVWCSIFPPSFLVPMCSHLISPSVSLVVKDTYLLYMDTNFFPWGSPWETAIISEAGREASWAGLTKRV